jgi:hypothetical protein
LRGGEGGGQEQGGDRGQAAAQEARGVMHDKYFTSAAAKAHLDFGLGRSKSREMMTLTPRLRCR